MITPIEIECTRETAVADFVTNIRQGQGQQIVLVHEQNWLEIAHDPLLQHSKRMSFESNIYDTLVVKGKLLVSNKHMPVRVFEVSEDSLEESPCLSFYDRKANSEQFLTPLQFAELGDSVIGAGKKFMSRYDLEKGKAVRFKAMDKTYISSLQVLDRVVVCGQFTGELSLFDLRSEEPHMDLVTRVKKANFEETCLLTVARKDNLSYLWDVRNMKQFVSCLQHPRYGNQRTGLDVSGEGLALFGGERGQLFIHSLKEQNKRMELSLGVMRCVSSILCKNQMIYCGVGEREFPLFGTPNSKGSIFICLPVNAQSR